VNDSSGNVGIGTASPAAKLQVNSATAGDGIRVTGNNFSGTNYYGSSVNATGVFTGLDSAGGFSTNVRDSGYLTYSTNNTERVRINSSGSVLVGSTTQIQSEKLGVTSGTANATQYQTISALGGSSLYVNQQQTTSVSTTAVAILNGPQYMNLCLVYGSNGTNRFADVVLMSVGTGTVNVISSLTASGTPPARTYTQSSSTLRLSVASGTYTVQVACLAMGSS